MHAVVRIAIDHCKLHALGMYNIGSDNALREKVVWHAKGRRLSVEKFDGEKVDKLIKICQIRQYFPRQKFAPYGIFESVIKFMYVYKVYVCI